MGTLIYMYNDVLRLCNLFLESLFHAKKKMHVTLQGLLRIDLYHDPFPLFGGRWGMVVVGLEE